MTLDFAIGDEVKKLVMYQPCGAQSYYVLLDGYYQGMIVLTAEGWRAYLSDIFTEEDIEMLLEKIRA